MNTLKHLPSEAKIKKLVRTILFGTHLHCPWCKSRRVYCSEERYRCRSCRRPFSLTSHTWLNNMKLSWQELYALIWCFVNHLSVQQAMRHSEFSEVTVRSWYEKLRINLPHDSPVLGGIVQMDEAYTKHKAIIAGKDIIHKKLQCRVVPKVGVSSVQKQQTSQFVVRHIAPGSKLYTDGNGVYRGIGSTWPVFHSYDVHSKWEFGLTSEIEGTFGNLRTFIRRKYHHVTCSKLPFVLAEFQTKFNQPELFKNPDNYLKNCLTLVPTC